MNDSTSAIADHATEFSVVADDSWNDVLASLDCRDIYYTREYHQLSAQLEDESTPVLLHLKTPAGQVALPLLVRPLPDGKAGFDAISAYGYGGPITAGDNPPITEFSAALKNWADDNDIVSTFLRFHPLNDERAAAPAGTAVFDIGGTVAWSIEPERDLEAAMHKHHRRVVRKARRQGVEVSVVRRPSDAQLAQFRELYDVTMKRQDAAKFYFFTDKYWSMMATQLREDLLLVNAEHEGEVVASLLCFATSPWLHYHLGASGDAARGIGASNLCFLEAAVWAQSQGFTRFHLGGGIGGKTDDSLFQFKHRHDPESPIYPFSIGKLVHDTDKYHSLAGSNDLDGFFPAYRTAPN